MAKIFAGAKDKNVCGKLAYAKDDDGWKMLYWDEACTVKAMADQVFDAFIKRQLVIKVPNDIGTSEYYCAPINFEAQARYTIQIPNSENVTSVYSWTDEEEG